MKKCVKIGCIVFLVVIFSSCGKNKSENQESGKQLIEIAYSGNIEEKGIRERMGALYTEKNPEVEIKWVDLGNEDRVQKTMLLISGKKAPDILYINEYVFSFAERGVLEPLNSYFENDPEISGDDFYEGLIIPVTVNGEIYAVPQEVSPFVIYYNKDMFDRAGVTYPTNDWTQEEFHEAAKRLTNPEKQEYGYKHYGGGWFDQTTNWLSRYGATWYSDDFKSSAMGSKEVLDGLKFLYQLVYLDKVTPNPAEAQAMGKSFDALFRSEKVAMDSQGLWMLPIYDATPLDFRWDVVTVPKAVNSNVKAGVLNWAISSDSKKKELAWDIIKFFVSSEAMQVLVESKMAMPSTKDAASNDLLLSYDHPENMEAFILAAENLELTDQLSAKRSEFFTAVGEEVDKMVLGEQTPEEAQDRIVERTNKILQR